jgi:perosamine synthetase
MDNNRFIPISIPSITEKEIAFVTDAVRSTWVSSIGAYIDRFENEFAAFCGAEYGVAVMNGTVAIQLALECLGIGPGDEVILPDLSFIATANAVLYVGATPVFVDIEPVTFCIDPAKIESKITGNTKVIMPVHLYGHPANMPDINAIAQRAGIFVVEDAAEAHGAKINGKPVGGWSDIATFSFYGNKNLTTGEGGMLVTSNKALMERAKYLRDHAMSKDRRYRHDEMGYNFRMTNLQAALGCAQMERSGDLLEKRKQIFRWYDAYLQDHSGIKLNITQEWAENAFWLVTAFFPGLNEAKRDRLMKLLKDEGIDSRPFFYPMSSMPYLMGHNTNDLQMTYHVSYRGINLPTYYDLTESDVLFICDTLLKVLDKVSLS